MKAMITRKLGMTSIIDDQGNLLGVTLLAASPNQVMQLKTESTDGYCSVKLGFETTKKANKPQVGQAKQAGLEQTPKVCREIRLQTLPADIKTGDSWPVDMFETGDLVKVKAISKGKGFAGTIKRHNFHRQLKSHGGKGATRQPGSIGSMYPQKVFKGKKMSGQMGHQTTTILNLKVALVDADKQVLGLVGAVPGPRRGLVLVRSKS